MTHFGFLEREWPGVFEAAGKAEAAVHADSCTGCFYARRASLTTLDALFASLPHRAFRGDL